MTAVLMLLAQTQIAAQGQCQPNCLGFTTISLDEDCSVEILPGMVLASPPCPNSNLQVQMRINGVWVPAIVNSSHINQNILVLVLDLNSGSNCFLNIGVEDNKLTELICPSDLPALSVNASCQAALSDYTALAILSGSCDNPQNAIVQTPAPGTLVNPGTVHVTLSASQGATCAFNVQINGGCGGN